MVRTTLELDDELFGDLAELARRRGASVERVIQDLLRGASKRTEPAEQSGAFLGFEPFASGDRKVSNALVDRLRDENDA
jgi:predicted transcriptional regulator